MVFHARHYCRGHGVARQWTDREVHLICQYALRTHCDCVVLDLRTFCTVMNNDVLIDTISDRYDDYEEYDLLTYPEGEDAVTAAECADCLLSGTSDLSSSDVLDVEVNSTDATTAVPTPEDGDGRADQEEAVVEYCESQIDFLTLFGGILIGATLTILVQCCCLASRSRKKSQDSYTVPYKFDEFVNP